MTVSTLVQKTQNTENNPLPQAPEKAKDVSALLGAEKATLAVTTQKIAQTYLDAKLAGERGELPDLLDSRGRDAQGGERREGDRRRGAIGAGA